MPRSAIDKNRGIYRPVFGILRVRTLPLAMEFAFFWCAAMGVTFGLVQL
jgi:hypothetical protein